MIHSASFLATGSAMAASAAVASAGLCRRTSSMTFSSASLSACEVVDVAAMAAGVGGGLRAASGGNAACWRVAGAIAGAGKGEAATDGVLSELLALVLFAFLSAPLAVILSVPLGTTLRAIGRGFGNGILGLAAAPAGQVDIPIASASVVAIAVDRSAWARADLVTAFLCDESRDGGCPSGPILTFASRFSRHTCEC